jgi:hypothetical protein
MAAAETSALSASSSPLSIKMTFSPLCNSKLVSISPLVPAPTTTCVFLTIDASISRKYIGWQLVIVQEISKSKIRNQMVVPRLNWQLDEILELFHKDLV